jgi:transcriptional regulator with XRE-family HTH domain
MASTKEAKQERKQEVHEAWMERSRKLAAYIWDTARLKGIRNLPDLADRAGMSPALLSHYIPTGRVASRGHLRPLSAEKLLQLARALGVEVGDLFVGAGLIADPSPEAMDAAREQRLSAVVEHLEQALKGLRPSLPAPESEEDKRRREFVQSMPEFHPPEEMAKPQRIYAEAAAAGQRVISGEYPSAEWVTFAFRGAKLIRVKGDSAADFARDGQIAVVRTDIMNVPEGWPCLVVTQDAAYVKRKVRPLRYQSINPMYPDLVVDPDEYVADYWVAFVLPAELVDRNVETETAVEEPAFRSA